MFAFLLSFASAAFVIGIAELAKTYRSLPTYVPYSFGYRGEAKLWGSRPAVAFASIVILFVLGAGIVFAAIASPADLRPVVTLTCVLSFVVLVQHFVFEAALSGSNRIPILPFYIVSIVLTALAYAMKHAIT